MAGYKTGALLVLDNVEHLMEGALVIGELVAAAPGLKVLATSREALRLSCELERPLPPLRAPNIGADAREGVTAELVRLIGHFPAVALFVERAKAVQPGFGLTTKNASTVADICRRLDGLPLAIELAASRVRVLSPEAILAKLGHRLDFLTGGPKDRPARQHTLRAAMDWSYDLLTLGEKALFRRLSVFVGGFTLEAAEAVSGVVGDRESSTVVDALDALAAKSLLRSTSRTHAVSRFGLLETLREYGLERLEAEGELEAGQRAHFSWCLELVERAEPALNGPQQAEWLDRLEADLPNIRAAFAWAVESGENSASALRLANALRPFWQVRSDVREGLRWLADALGQPGLPGDVRAKALQSAGIMARNLAEYDQAHAYLQTSLALFKELDDRFGQGRVLGTLGTVAVSRGDYASARTLFESSLAVTRELGDQRSAANAMVNLALVLNIEGALEQALRWNEQALAIYRQIGDLDMVASTLENIGASMARSGNLEAAVCYEETLALRRQVGNRRGVAKTLGKMASIAHARGDLAEAAQLLRESMSIHRELASVVERADCLTQIALVAAAPLTQPLGVATSATPARMRGAGRAAYRQRLGRATAWIAAADAVRETTDNVLYPFERAIDMANQAALRAALGEVAFDAASQLGRLLSFDQACGEAEAWAAGVAAGEEWLPTPQASTGVDMGGLTERELEVARLIGLGKTYRQIAAELSVTVKTVEKHVSNVLGKLGLENRSQVAVWSQAHGLVEIAR